MPDVGAVGHSGMYTNTPLGKYKLLRYEPLKNIVFFKMLRFCDVSAANLAHIMFDLFACLYYGINLLLGHLGVTGVTGTTKNIKGP
jgi:hypothetical protein